MKSHQLAKILLDKPNVPVVIEKLVMHLEHKLIEVSSVAWTNHAHFMDSSGFEGDDYNSGREAIEIK